MTVQLHVVNNYFVYIGAIYPVQNTMSSKPPTSPATCAICSQLYTDPRMLQCLHTFCSKCLKKILGEQRLGTSLKCPTCKKINVIPRGSVIALPKDLRKSYEAEVAQIVSKMQSKEEISCDQCVDTSSGPAVSFCVNCSDFLCKACVKHHKTWRKTLNHELQPVGSSKPGSSVAAKPLSNIPHKPMNCQLHEDETLKFYCETCGTLICRDCMAIEHAGHKYDRIEKVSEKEKVHLVSLLRSASDAKAKLDGAITKGSKVVQQVQAKQKVVEKDIKSAFKALNKALATREQALLSKAGAISLGKQTALTMQGEEFQSLSKEIIETSEMITAATKVYTPAEMLSAKGAMANKLEQLLKQYQVANLDPCRNDAIPSMLDTIEVIQQIKSFGMVAGGSSPGEAKTDLNIPRAIRGKSRKVVVTACDMKGEPFPYGGERVEATLTLLPTQYCEGDSLNPALHFFSRDNIDPFDDFARVPRHTVSTQSNSSIKQVDPQITSVTAKIVDNKNGTYIATFTPQSIGEHELSITIDGKHIKESPFSMYVRQERNYTSLSSIQQTLSLSANPYDVAVEDNEVYVAMFGYQCIEVFNQNGQRICTIGNKIHSSGSMNPYSTTVASQKRFHGGLGLNMQLASSIDDTVLDATDSVQFNSPIAISVQESVLYVVDSGNCCVHQVTTTGNAISTFGTRGSGNGQLNNPRGICFDKDGHIFISECGNNRISVFADNGTFLYHIIGNTADGSNLNGPWGLAIDQCGNLHVANTNTSQIKVFTTQGKYVSQYNSGVSQPAGIAIDEEGNIFITDYGLANNVHGGGKQGYQHYGHGHNMQVCVLNSEHNVIHSFGANQSATGITIDKNGFIYVCCYNSRQVNKF